MGNYTMFLKFENPRRGRQAINFSENDPKILDLKSSSEQIIFGKLSLGAPEYKLLRTPAVEIENSLQFFFFLNSHYDLSYGIRNFALIS